MLTTRVTRVSIWCGLAVVALALSACQSTTQSADGPSGTASVYPAVNSPGVTGSSITIALRGTANRTSQSWEINGPVYQILNNIVKQINADGGVEGRQLQPIWTLDYMRGSDTSPEASAEASCDHTVHSQPTFMIQQDLTTGDLTNLVRAGCVGANRTINIVNQQLVSKQQLAEHPDVVAPIAVDDETAGRLLVEGLDRQRFFDGARRVAILSPSGVYSSTVRSIIVDRLAEVGIDDPLIVDNAVSTPAEVNSLVLRLKNEGVDAVLWFDNDRYIYDITLAMLAQEYTPRFGTIPSGVPANLVTNSSGAYPANQMFVTSWLGPFGPGQDEAATWASIPKTPASKHCLDAQEAAGVKVHRALVRYVLEGCDNLALLQAALKASDAEEPSSASFFAGLAKLDHFESAYGLTLDFSSGRTGGSQVWDLKGDPGCTCLKVVGGPHPIAEE